MSHTYSEPYDQDDTPPPKHSVYERTIVVYVLATDDADADKQVDDAWDHLGECDEFGFYPTREGAQLALEDKEADHE